MARQIFRVAFIWLVVVLCAMAQQPSNEKPQIQPSTRAATSSKPLTFTAAIKKTIAYLEVSFSQDGEIKNVQGTCFFIDYADARLSKDQTFRYLITNRHMAEPGIERGERYLVTKTTLRLNLRNADTTVQSQQVILPEGSIHWVYPSDDSIDLAVLPLALDAKRFDIATFPVSLLATKDVIEENNIGEGDKVLFAGYFYQFAGQQRFQPIVREGLIAMMPDEKIKATLNKMESIYLADVHVFGGNSGSPLLVNIKGERNGTFTATNSFPYRILGVISGYFFEDTDFTLTIATTANGTFRGNSGIASVVPANDLKALLESPTLQALRDTEVARQVAESGNKP